MDPSYKNDESRFLGLFWKGKSCLITTEIWYLTMGYIYKNKNSAAGYVAPEREHVSVTYNCNSYS